MEQEYLNMLCKDCRGNHCREIKRERYKEEEYDFEKGRTEAWMLVLIEYKCEDCGCIGYLSFVDEILY